MSLTPADFDVLLLGCILCKSDSNDMFAKFLMSLQSINFKEQERAINKMIYKPKTWAGLHAYIVTREGARKLLQEFPSATYHVDVMCRNSASLNIYAAQYAISDQDLNESTTSSNLAHDFMNMSDNVFRDVRFDQGKMSLKFGANMILAEIFGVQITASRLLMLIVVVVVCMLVRV